MTDAARHAAGACPGFQFYAAKDRAMAHAADLGAAILTATL
jgi:hypothetical protein